MTDSTPITQHDLTELVSYLCLGLQAPDNARIAETGEVIGLHSDCTGEDGRRVRLWDLNGDHTGVQMDDGPIWRCD